MPAIVPASSPRVTVTMNEVVAVLPATSVALHVTVVEPIWKRVPDAGAHATGTAGSRLSVAAGAENVTAAPSNDVAVALTSTAGPNTGAIVSAGNENRATAGS